MEYIEDFITGKEVRNTGPEEKRQAVEKFLVNEKGFSKEDVLVDALFEIEIAQEAYKTKLDLVLETDGKKLCAFKIAAGSLSSWSREVVAGARILTGEYQIPFSVVSDGENAEVYDSVTGKLIGEGLESIPSKEELLSFLERQELSAYPEDRLERQKMVFKTYDTLNVNR